jgi:hypothetical protein
MFQAELISLSDGQSYKNVDICLTKDLRRMGLPLLFEDYTFGFYADEQFIMGHEWNIALIHYDKQPRGGPGAVEAERILLQGDISYAPAKVFPVSTWQAMGIPFIFAPSQASSQCVLSCDEGTFITSDRNVASIILAAPQRRRKLNRGQAVSSVVHKMKQAAKPEVVHGKVSPRAVPGDGRGR